MLMECSLGKLSDAMELFSSLPAKGLKTDVTYKIMINDYVKEDYSMLLKTY